MQRNHHPKQADRRAFGNGEAASLPRVGRFCVRRRGRFLDRWGGHGHFGRGRLSLVAESRGRSCSCSGKGRLAPPIPVTPKTVGRDVSALWASWKERVHARILRNHRELLGW